MKQKKKKKRRGLFEDFKSLVNPGEAAKDVDTAKKVLIVAVTSDRGLCGAINSGVAKFVKLEAKRLEDAGKKVELVVIGEKGRAIFVRDRSDRILANMTEIGKTPVTFLEASLIAERIVDTDADRVSIVYNRFKSAIAYEALSIDIPTKAYLSSKVQAIAAKYTFNADALLSLYEFHLANTIYAALLENATSELSSRMTAMGNASTNAAEMLGKLRLTYNRTRQAVITRTIYFSYFSFYFYYF